MASKSRVPLSDTQTWVSQHPDTVFSISSRYSLEFNLLPNAHLCPCPSLSPAFFPKSGASLPCTFFRPIWNAHPGSTHRSPTSFFRMRRNENTQEMNEQLRFAVRWRRWLLIEFNKAPTIDLTLVESNLWIHPE